MTTRLVAVLVVPTVHEGGWRAALRRAAALADWDYRDYWSVGDVPVDAARSTVVVTMDEATLDQLDPTDWIVLAASPEEVMARSKAQFDLDDQAALAHSASRLTAASVLIEAGARLYRASELEIEVPGLGRVPFVQGANDLALPSIPADAVATLQIFAQIPPPQGASAIWPASVFQRFDDEDPGSAARTIDLTGRGRILIHGPYLAIPAGRWRVTFEFDFEVPIGSVPFRFEWGEVADVVLFDTRATASGRYSVSLERDWAEAGRAEVRIWLYHAVFQGEFRLLSCRVDRL